MAYYDKPSEFGCVGCYQGMGEDFFTITLGPAQPTKWKTADGGVGADLTNIGKQVAGKVIDTAAGAVKDTLGINASLPTGNASTSGVEMMTFKQFALPSLPASGTSASASGTTASASGTKKGGGGTALAAAAGLGLIALLKFL